MGSVRPKHPHGARPIENADTEKKNPRTDRAGPSVTERAAARLKTYKLKAHPFFTPPLCLVFIMSTCQCREPLLLASFSTNERPFSTAHRVIRGALFASRARSMWDCRLSQKSGSTPKYIPSLSAAPAETERCPRRIWLIAIGDIPVSLDTL
jgi:hypothetical protein